MAATQFARGGTNTNLVPQIWSKDDFKHAFNSNPLAPFMGGGDDSIIQVGKDFLKQQVEDPYLFADTLDMLATTLNQR